MEFLHGQRKRTIFPFDEILLTHSVAALHARLSYRDDDEREKSRQCGLAFLCEV